MTHQVASPRGEEVTRYPDDVATLYRDNVWGTRTIADEFSAVAQQRPDATALVSLDLNLTYAELDQLTDRVAVGLRRHGLQTGDKVLLQIENSGWAVVSWYAILKAGLIPVATLPQHREHEIGSIVDQCEPAAHVIQHDYRSQDLVALGTALAATHRSLRLLLSVREEAADGAPAALSIEGLSRDESVSPAEARAEVARVQAELAVDDLAVLQLSGGTTSTPKLIPRLHTEYWYNAKAYAKGIGMDTDGCILHVQPVVHNAGIVCGLHAAHALGGAFAVSSYEPTSLMQVAEVVAVTHMLLPPSLAHVIDAHPKLRAALGSLTAVTWVLGPITDAVLAGFETDSCRILQMFGMGEGLCMVTPPSVPAEIRLTTVGTPIGEFDEVRVYLPGTEEEVPSGEVGELCCRGAYTIRGYYNAPERNAEAFTADGFYRTGDLVRSVEHDGATYYRLEGRIKDVINRGVRR